MGFSREMAAALHNSVLVNGNRQPTHPLASTANQGHLMTRLCRLLAIVPFLLLQGCDINYATFVTSTHLGIKADTKTEEIAIGIGRTDLFLGPGYPENGAAPSAFGHLQTNAQVFSPQVAQLYATGAAADAVTSNNPPQPSTFTPPDLSGVRRPLIFSTNTNVGLNIGFVANAPSSFNLGYNREEFSIIPMQPSLAKGGKDVYAPVLASITLNVSSNTPTNSGLSLGQFFATGTAATNLASNPDIRKIFTAAATAQIDQASLQAAQRELNINIAKVKAYLDGNGGYAANCQRLKGHPEFHANLWASDPCQLSETEFINTLNTRPDLLSAAITAIPTTP
jgi:hypothetical protein